MTGRVVATVVAAVVTVLSVGWGGPAAAHATLQATSPADDATVAELPEQVGLTFSEEMSAPAYVVVTAPDGSAVTSGDPEVTGAEVAQPLDGAGERGTYTVAFRVFSADGHQVSGRFLFHVGERSEPAPAADGTTAADAAEGDANPAGGPAAVGASGSSGDTAGWTLHAVIGALLLGAAGLLWWLSRVRPG